MSNHFKTENTQITKSEKRETGVSTSFRSQVKALITTSMFIFENALATVIRFSKI